MAGQRGKARQAVPILGYRRDRVGARLIGILNVLRFQALFGADAARFLWVSEPDGPYPDLADPAEIFDPAFLKDVIETVTRAPDQSCRAQLREAAQGDAVDRFAARLADGALWACDAAFDIIRFKDERADAVARQVRGLTGSLALSPPLAAARAAARARLAAAGSGEPVAIHLRRGDILDGDPWSWQAWPSKYAPDEYYRAFLDGVGGPVIAFSDTPAAITHLAAGDPRIVPVGDLIEGQALTTAQRDVLEILLMADCARVAAPAFSAFSQAAHAVGGVTVVSLPQGLAPAARQGSDAALLDRAMRRHGSFFAPGDLAQSLIHVMPHAAASGAGAALVDRFARKRGFLTRFPFVASALAELASRVDRRDTAAALTEGLAANPKATPRDRNLGAQVSGLITAGSGGATGSEGWDYLTDLFAGRRADGPVMPRLGALVLGAEGAVGRALGMPEQLALHLAGAFAGADGQLLLPAWALQQGWVELIQMDEMARRVRTRPAISVRLGPAAAALAAAEADSGGAAPLLDAALLGWAATGLVIHNRLARAMRLLEAILAADPGDAMAAKRMADACFAAGNQKAAWRWMDRALETDPAAPLIHLSAAARLAGLGHTPSAHARNPDAGSAQGKRQRRHLRRAAELAPDLALVGKLDRHLRGLGARGQAEPSAKG